MPQETPKEKKPEAVYHVHNVVRSQETRLTRVQAARRHRMNLLLGGGILRVPRGRFMPITESLLRKLQPELLRSEAEGAIKVTKPDGQRVDIMTLKPVGPGPTSTPLPNKPLDSAANDQTYEHGVGQHMPPHPGGKAVNEGIGLPEVLSGGVPEGVEDEVVDVQEFSETPHVEEVEEVAEEEVSEAVEESKPKKKPRRSR
jgi:hypothetical protein